MRGMPRAAIRVLIAGAVMAGSVEHATAQTVARSKIDVSTLGPAAGERVPDFSLKDQYGKTWTRQSIMGPRGAMLVFIRSAEW